MDHAERDAAPRRSTQVGAVTVDGEMVLFHAGRRTLHRLNTTARAVWESIDGTMTVSEIARALARVYEGGAERVEGDVLATVRMLCELGAVDLGGDAGLSGGAETAAGQQPPASETVVEEGYFSWSAGPFRALDAVFALRSTESLVGREVGRALEPLLAASGESPSSVYSISLKDDRYRVVHGATVISDGSDAAGARSAVLWHVNRLAAERVVNAVCLHAGAVEIGGRAALLPALSESGKSTLTTALVSQGARYLTDELAAIDVETLLVRPFAKAIALDAGSVALFPQLAGRLAAEPSRQEWHIDPLDVGAVAAASPVGVVMTPMYVADADAGIRVERLRGLSALRALLDHSLPFDSLGGRGFEVLGQIANQVPVYRITYSSLSDACRAVRDALA